MRRAAEIDPASLEFLAAAEYALSGLQEWIERYAVFLAAEAGRCADAGRADQLSGLARIAGRVAHEPPTTFFFVGCIDRGRDLAERTRVNLRFQRAVLSDPDGRKRLDAMLRAYFMAGGQEMQINSADTAELRAAQANPERYRDLVVRVAGFSAFFINLSRDMQDEIIARTEHR